MQKQVYRKKHTKIAEIKELQRRITMIIVHLLLEVVVE
jgi:hypothetical protein